MCWCVSFFSFKKMSSMFLWTIITGGSLSTCWFVVLFFFSFISRLDWSSVFIRLIQPRLPRDDRRSLLPPRRSTTFSLIRQWWWLNRWQTQGVAVRSRQLLWRPSTWNAPIGLNLPQLVPWFVILADRNLWQWLIEEPVGQLWMTVDG